MKTIDLTDDEYNLVVSALLQRHTTYVLCKSSYINNSELITEIEKLLEKFKSIK